MNLVEEEKHHDYIEEDGGSTCWMTSSERFLEGGVEILALAKSEVWKIWVYKMGPRSE